MDAYCMTKYTRAQLGRPPQKYIEEWSSENKRICVLMTHLLSRKSYAVDQSKNIGYAVEQYS